MNAPVDVVGRIGVVLRAVSAAEPHGTPTSEVARRTGLARPTAHRLLVALLREGLLDRTGEGLWLLGPEFYLLGMPAAARYDVTSVARPFVRHLADSTQESVFFTARRGEETVCLVREEGAFPLRSHVLYEGARFPLGVVSAGMAILAHLSDAEISDYLRRTDLEPRFGAAHSAANTWSHVQATRTAGYATNPGLVVEGSWGMAAAVFDEQGAPAWALSLTGVEQRFTERRRPLLGEQLLYQAHELTKALRGRGGAAGVRRS